MIEQGVNEVPIWEQFLALGNIRCDQKFRLLYLCKKNHLNQTGLSNRVNIPQV